MKNNRKIVVGQVRQIIQEEAEDLHKCLYYIKEVNREYGDLEDGEASYNCLFLTGKFKDQTEWYGEEEIQLDTVVM